MSGVEVAGLVLGALPLIIEAIKIYADGVSTVERYLRYEEPLLDLYWALETEYIMYQNTCEQLLDGIVDSNTEMAMLLQDPGGPAWKKQELECMVKHRLSRSYPSYERAMYKMELAVDGIKGLLKLGPTGEVQINSENGFKKEYKRLKFSLKKSQYDKLVTTIRENNFVLEKLTQQSLNLESSRATRQSKKSRPNFKAIQEYARSVYESIQSGLKCGCSTSHGANLRLDTMTKIETGPVRFDIILSYTHKESAPVKAPWKLEAMEIGPIDDVSQVTETGPFLPCHPKPNPKDKRVKFQETKKKATTIIASEMSNLTQISDLCGTICQLQQPSQGNCIGFLVDNFTNQKLGVFRLSTSVYQQKPSSLLPLRQVLSQSQSDHVLRISGFTLANRVRLAVSLTSGFLRLHGTPWLQGTWDKDEIVFPQDTLKRQYERSYVFPRDLFEKPIKTQKSSRSDLLSDLGFLLIEILFGKPMDVLIDSIKEPGEDGSTASRWKRINRLVDHISFEVGTAYSKAVHRCISYDFGKDVTGISDEDFSYIFYDQVVSPLEDLLQAFPVMK
ncbi:uncharacterized protein K452DRAFT_316124 [Aplosporella prunicola CBS 121167]|uniref:DUF7580 domain-containing protein n=1 Tax=Aplosporella prunicola CBS 121167 TaxID=1176127 RepID=A0A6A6BQA5_9PEZI|nr:uncharacterized protein K452DRAFT_316124 [Aplosporella prunicola CBS 121167]KAF2144987.1 hypothetical protein K452DRAFT_316124 [Aplosporella prunicola CBS 121167]